MNPKNLEPAPNEVQIPVSELSIHLHGWHFEAKKNALQECLIYFHGNGQNRSAHFLSMYWVLDEGIDLYIYDYPGYGQTAGKPSPESTVAAAKAVIRGVAANPSCENLYVYGHSLGGQISMRAVWELQGELVPRVLVVDSSFLSYRQVAKEAMKKSAWTWAFQFLPYLVLSDNKAIGDHIAEISTPMLVIHSEKDEVVPFYLGQEIYQEASSPKKFLKKISTGHNSLYSSPEGMALKKKLVEELRSYH